MRKIIKITCCMLIVMCIMCSACAEELIRNGDLSDITSAGLAAEWYRDMWYTDNGVSALSVEEIDGETCLCVQNITENDARFAQTVAVEPGTLYRIRCLIRAEGCPEDGIGATVSVENTFSYSESVYDTDGEWTEAVLYGETSDDQTELTVFLRVGGYSALTTGTAWFKDISMEKADSVPDGAAVQSLGSLSAGNAWGNSDDEGDTVQEPGRATPTYLLLAFLYVLAVVAVIRRSGRCTACKGKTEPLFAAIIAAALLIRLFLAIKVRGYNTDVTCFTAWSERIFKNGLTGFYSDDSFCDYPPGAMLLLWPSALLRRLCGFEAYSDGHIMLVKLLAICCDLLTAWVIQRIAAPKLGQRAALLLTAFAALNPATMVDSAAWGQMDSVYTLLVLLCAWKASEKKYTPSLMFFAAAALMKPQSLLFAPLGLAAILINILRSDDRGRAWKDFGIGVAAALGLMYAVAFPFCVGRANGFIDAILYPVRWLTELYGSTMGGYDYITVNALNLYDALNMNWKHTSSVFGWTLFAWIAFAGAYLYAILLYFKGRNAKHLFLCGGILMALIFAFGPMIHERYIFPALILLAAAYAAERDRRILISAVAVTVTLAMNQILVLQGGMDPASAAQYGHLQSSEQWLNAALSWVNVLNALYLCKTGWDICVRGKVTGLSLPESVPVLEEPGDYRLHLKKFDRLAMLIVTGIYAVVAFVNLGTTAAPESGWESDAPGDSIVFDLGETQSFRMTYYGGICNSTFTVELSDDGETWTTPCYAQYDQGEIFRWIRYVPMNDNQKVLYGDSSWGDGETDSEGITYASALDAYPYQTARYVRITTEAAGFILYEVGFLDPDDQLIAAEISGFSGSPDSDPAALLDEQDTVAIRPSYYNSTYFDEIYHARTAFEHLNGLNTYEWTHPPLGKVLMMVGIAVFGMNPFGWRFMGALMGVLMLPLMYLLVKQLTGKSRPAFTAMLLFSVDSMHFTLTRIATIDSYAVFFILLMYFFMVRYSKMSWNAQPFCRTLIPLGLCGISMGLAWATKWTGIYASVGLAAILLWTLIRRYREHKPMFWENTAKTVGFCLIFFVAIPVTIYFLSYYWQLKPEGGLTLRRVIQLQESMFNYHAGLGGDTHYFRSDWYEWPVIWWPMWFYSGTGYLSGDMITSISCMGNPAVWWFGLFAMLFTAIRCAWQRQCSRRSIFVLLAFASQYLPWVLVPRSTFIYHYFASVPFIIIASAMLLEERRSDARRENMTVLVSASFFAMLCVLLALAGAASYLCFMCGIAAASLMLGRGLSVLLKNRLTTTQCVLLTAALLLFVAFYPLESGLPVSRSYASMLRWFKWYNY